MTLFPTREQRKHAEERLRMLKAVTDEHKNELEKLQSRIRELEAENVKLSRECDNAYVEIDALHRGAATNAEVLRPQFPAHMLGKPVTTPEYYFNLDMDTAPRGGKLIVLNPGRVATFAIISERNKHDFLGWAPMPKIPKDKP